MKTLSIIGAGRVGQTLGRLWAQQGVFAIQGVLNRSRESTATATAFLEEGKAVASIQEMRPADGYMISTPDAQISACCEALVRSGLVRTGTIVFHCSGALPSSDLGLARERGAYVGSLHPIKSFAKPEAAAATFAGTFCGIEGDEDALAVLWKACEAIGGRPLRIDPAYKTAYHAGAVIVCNYLTALIEWGIQTFMRAGLERATTRQVIEPMVRDTVENIFQSNTVQALTGPIARGDHDIVGQQFRALRQCDERFGRLYRDLGAVALELARAQGTASAESLAILEKLFQR